MSASIISAARPVSRAGGIPLYLQVMDRVREMIGADGLGPGDPLPGELELQQRFGVSRATVRQALAELTRDGQIERHQGRGTYVAIPRLKRALPELTSYSEHLSDQGLRSTSRLVALEHLGPREAPRDRYSADEPAPADAFGRVSVVRFVRLRMANGTPIGIHSTATPRAVADDIGLSRANLESQQFSFYAALEQNGHRLSWAEEHLAARGAGDCEAQLLEVPSGSPVMSVLRLSRDVHGDPVEVVRAVYLGDKYDYVVQLERRLEEAAFGVPRRR